MSNSIWSLKGLFASPRYEIGDIYLTTRVGNPNTLLGYGTWELIPGKTLVCVDTSDSDFNIVKKTGGEKMHTLKVSEIPPAHLQRINDKASMYYRNGFFKYGTDMEGVAAWGNASDMELKTEGGGQPHNNLQPYFTCYIWIRTA